MNKMARVFKNKDGETRYDCSQEKEETLQFIKEMEKENDKNKF